MGRPAFVWALALGLLAAFAAAASVSLASSRALDDGCLVTSDAKGVVRISLRSGFVLGRFDSGQITVVDPTPADGALPKVSVTGYEKGRPISETKSTYIGDQVRFWASGRAIISINATGIYTSAVGKGIATLSATTFIQSLAGQFSVDSDSFCTANFQPMPDAAARFTIGGTP
jgi:hypothetical protein